MSGPEDFTMSEADAMEEALRHEEMDRYAEKPDDELKKELEAKGYDEDATIAAILRARDEVYAAPGGTGTPPVAMPSPAAAPPAPAAPTGRAAPVASLDEARKNKKREGFARIAPLALAAGVAFVAELGGVHVAGNYRPPVTTTYRTYVAPPTAEQRAHATKEYGLRLCKLGYYGECGDWLDAAQRLDPQTDSDPRVVEARKEIASAESGQSPIRMPDNISKPPLGPTERPLQRRP